MNADDQKRRVVEATTTRNIHLGPRLSDSEVRAFERRHGVELPGGFRWFLTEVGNGADGPPAYGLLPLGEVPSDLTADERREWTYDGNLGRPFPFTEPWIWEGGEKTTEGDQDQVGHGGLFLGTDGCAMYWRLIVTGPERGNVWLSADVGIQHTQPKRDFLTWLDDWLAGRTEWFE